MKSVITILVNIVTGTFHPILYLESPMPGNTQPSETTRRFKSKFHHTTGFATKEEAIASAKELEPKVKENFVLHSDVIMDMDSEVQWDGEGIPAANLIYDCERKSIVLGGAVAGA